VSVYESATSTERETLRQARGTRRDAGTVAHPFDPTLPENEVPKCAAYFDHSAGCDLPGSHICGPSELALALAEMFRVSG
jgi:hypothetical protein